LVFSFPVALVLIGVAVFMRRSSSGRDLRALGAKARFLALSPSLAVIALWVWAGALGGPHVANGVYDSPQLRAAAGWRHSAIYLLLGIQVVAAVTIPLLLPRGRRAAWAYGALQLWVGAMAAMLAHYAVLGLPVPVV
jgi:hypothetical protein